MPTNEYLPFGTGVGAPVMTQVAYAGFAPQGFAPGLAPKENINKALRQPAMIASMIGEFIKGAGYDALDDGNRATLLANFILALGGVSVGGFTFSLAADGYLQFPADPITGKRFTVQWGTFYLGDLPALVHVDTAIVFPIAFPTLAVFFAGTVIDSNGTAVGIDGHGSAALTVTGTSYTVGEFDSAAQDVNVYWLAAGF